MDCDREKLTTGKGRIWPKKHFMDRPGGGGEHIYIYTYLNTLYIYIERERGPWVVFDVPVFTPKK